MEYTLQIVFTGIMATAIIDLWALILKNGLRQQTTDWAMVGRWVAHLPRGVFVHKPIGKSHPVTNERMIGWATHYLTGVIYALVYMMIVIKTPAGQPTLMSAIVFGVVTVLAPWFILQPGMGMGILARNAPNPAMKRLVSLSVHGIFGIALFFSWYTYSAVFTQ